MNVDVRTAQGLNGTVVILAAWCPRCRQESMPDGNGDCSFCGRAIVDEHTLKAKDAIASTNTNGGNMTSTATAVECKIEGCGQDAEDRVGRYAKLCPRHKQEARETAAAAPRPPAAPTRSSATGGGYLRFG